MKSLFKFKGNQIIILLIVLLSCILIIGLSALAAFTTSYKANAEARVGNIILTTDVQAYAPLENAKNPYCLVTVKNYNNDDDISTVGTSYELIVESKDGSTLPIYTWSVETGYTGNPTGLNTGEFGVEGKQQNIHRITFENVGDSDFQKDIKIRAEVVQK